MNVADVTPALFIKNEEYWIHYVLRDLLLTFDKVIVLDTGSTDSTKIIIRETADAIGKANLVLIEADYGNNANLIGNGPNVLRSKVTTPWMFLVAGDEIWLQPQLNSLLSHTIPSGARVVMAGNKNLEDVNGSLKVRTHDTSGKDILFASDVKWVRTDHPFESYGLGTIVPMSQVHYVPAHEVFAYHVRHTRRSSHKAFFRDEKYGYFPYGKGHHDLPVDWLSPSKYENPYL